MQPPGRAQKPLLSVFYLIRNRKSTGNFLLFSLVRLILPVHAQVEDDAKGLILPPQEGDSVRTRIL